MGNEARYNPRDAGQQGPAAIRPIEPRAAIRQLVAELRQIEGRIVELCATLPAPGEEFEILSELRSAMDCVNRDLLADAIETLELAASSSENRLRHAFDQRRQWLAATRRSAEAMPWLTGRPVVGCHEADRRINRDTTDFKPAPFADAPPRLDLASAGETQLLDGSQATAAYLGKRYADSHQEVMGVLYLNVQSGLIATEEIFRGTISRIAVEPRPILIGALRYRASGLILYHNHPSGDPTPSAEDIAFTRIMINAGGLLGVTVIEHLIVGTNRWVSLRRRKPIGELMRERFSASSDEMFIINGELS